MNAPMIETIEELTETNGTLRYIGISNAALSALSEIVTIRSALLNGRINLIQKGLFEGGIVAEWNTIEDAVRHAENRVRVDLNKLGV